MKNFLKASNFLVCKNIKEHFTDVSFYSGSDKKIHHNLETNFKCIIGYQYLNDKLIDGEYVKIRREGNCITIRNDFYASIPVYIYNDNQVIIYSSSIFLINETLQSNLSFNSNYLFVYFAFGFLPATSNTIYSNLKTLPPNSKIKINPKYNKSDFKYFHFDENINLKSNNLLSLFNSAVSSKTNINKNSKKVFCLSGGLDSFLGGISLKQQNICADTYTWGLKNSMDIRSAKKRSVFMELSDYHSEFFIDELKIRYQDFHNFSKFTGGLSPSSSIYFMLFSEHLSLMKKKFHIYCDFLEITRRWYVKEDELRKNYLTPKSISDEYFVNNFHYKTQIEKTFRIINEYYDNYMYMYLLDRCVKGAFYKNAIIRAFNNIKITLTLDKKFLSANNSFIKSGGNSYKYLIDQFNWGKFNSNLLNEKKLRPSQKSFPFSVKDLLKTNKKLYCEIIQQENNKELSQIFNLDKVYFSLKNNSYIPKSEWFFHRLINLLIFKNENKIGLQ